VSPPPAPPFLRVLVADDFPLIRLAIREQLEGEGFVVCAEADHAGAAVEAALALRPDICLLDLGMQGGVLGAMASILDHLPETRVVLMTSEPSRDELLAAFTGGAAGYLVKDVDTSRLALILLDVAAGELAFPRTFMHSLASRVRLAAADAV
jgi:DNA-binding NarL/FixJ family response regulator